jgi:hypothetical protein
VQTTNTGGRAPTSASGLATRVFCFPLAQRCTEFEHGLRSRATRKIVEGQREPFRDDRVANDSGTRFCRLVDCRLPFQPPPRSALKTICETFGTPYKDCPTTVSWREITDFSRAGQHFSSPPATRP